MIRLMNPTARARRVRQRDSKRLAAAVRYVQGSPDELIERKIREKTGNRQAPHGNDQRRPDDLELGIEPDRAGVLLLSRRNSISASTRARAGIAARNRGDVDTIADRRFIKPGTLEPPKQRLPCSTSERTPTARLHLARRLANEHRPRTLCRRHDRQHSVRKRARAARPERTTVFREASSDRRLLPRRAPMTPLRVLRAANRVSLSLSIPDPSVVRMS